MGVLLKATGLAYHLGKYREALLQNINLTVTAGELIVIQGGSGAGKSTLAELLTGVAQPSAGSVERCGLVAWVPQQFLLYQDLTVQENMEFFSRVNDFQGECQTLLTWGGLDQRQQEKAGQLPVGCRKMLQICVALTRDPALMICDEPLVGLDERQTAVVTQLLQELKKSGKGIVVTTVGGATAVTGVDRVYRLQGGTLASENPGSFPVGRAEG